MLFCRFSAFWCSVRNTAGLIGIVAGMPVWASPSNKPPAPASPPAAEVPRLPEGNGLTPEERARMREIFSQIWNNPEVVASREEVHQATVKYHETIKAAVEKTDPSATPLLEKMRRNIKSSAGKHHMGPGLGGKRPAGPLTPLPQNPDDALKRILDHDPSLDTVDQTSRERFLTLAQETAKDPELQGLLTTAVKTTEPSSDALQARRKFREKLFRAMTARDPWAEEVLRRSSAKGRDRNSAPAGGPPALEQQQLPPKPQ
jgi:hypothetical protein